MPCLLAMMAFFFPRVVIALLVVVSDYIGDAYQTTLWPLLGFFFFPYTTLAYALAINTNGNVSGVYLAIVVLAALMDLGVTGGAEASRRKRVGKAG